MNDFKKRIDKSTMMTDYNSIIGKLQASLDIEQLKAEHKYSCLPDIDSLLWEGHMKEVSRIILVDIDHTLAHSAWRDDMIGNTPWDEYHRWGCHDKPVLEVKSLINTLGEDDWQLIGITGRTENFRAMTTQWLATHEIFLDDLMMRADDDFRSNPVMKVEMCKERWGEPLHNHIAFLIDDNEEVCSAFKAECITTLQISIRRPNVK